jgi:AraC-like DNA-binding protein
VIGRAGLPLAPFGKLQGTLTTAQWFAFWQALGEMRPEAAWGLQLPMDIHIEQFNPITLLAMSAPNLAEAMRRITYHLGRHCGVLVQECRHNGVLGFEIAWPGSAEAPPAPLADSMLAAVVELGRRGTQENLVPQRVSVTHGGRQRSLYQEHFGCEVEFGAERNIVWYSLDAASRPFRSHDPVLTEKVAPRLEAAIRDDLPLKGVSDQVKALFNSRLFLQNPRIQSVAGDLHMSPRSLQRHLADEGTSFRRLVGEVRLEIARHYLRDSELDMAQIAVLIGFEEVSSFNRAFLAWTGVSPGQWRRDSRRKA